MATPTSRKATVRNIRLYNNGNHFEIAAENGSGERFNVFYLPRLPLTTLLWCQSLCELFRVQQHASLILLLLLDHQTRRWVPLLPTQKCSSRGSRLKVQLSDFASIVPTLLTAGTFQTSDPAGLLAAQQRVPPFDGFHVVQQRRSDSTWIFIVCNGESRLANPATFTVDELKQAIRLLNASFSIDSMLATACAAQLFPFFFLKGTLMSQSKSAQEPNDGYASTTSASAADFFLIPTARLRIHERKITARPPTAIGQTAKEFPLPLIPKSVIDQLIASCQWFWQRHRRCVGFVLIWEPEQGPWAAMIPAQRCSGDSACWSALLRDLPDFKPSSLLLGSFQSRVLGSDETAADCPPPNDGVHFVLDVGSEKPRISTFLRCQSRNHPVPTSDRLFDDLEAMFDAAMDRIMFT